MATNPDLGKLCYTGSGSLAYSKQDNTSLIFKDATEQCTIKVNFGIQSWVCNTYDCYHEIKYSAQGSFEGGSGTIVSSLVGMPDSAEFVVKPSSGSTSSFVVTVTATTSCGALDKEHPGATCSVAAAQKGATPKSKGNTDCNPNVQVRIYVSFDSNGKLTGIN